MEPEFVDSILLPATRVDEPIRHSHLNDVRPDALNAVLISNEPDGPPSADRVKVVL